MTQNEPVPPLLLVEDEDNIGEPLSIRLRLAGYPTSWVKTAASAKASIENEHPWAVILDVMLPDSSGLSLCDELRRQGNQIPVLMLSALGQTEDRVSGIRAGADDYLPKPFSFDELLARLEALRRRFNWTHPQRTTEILHFGPFSLDRKNLVLKHQYAEKQIVLTLLETKLLETLAKTPGHALDRATLLRDVWGLSGDVQTRSLDNFVLRLRQAFSELGEKTQWIESVRGVGYRLRALDQKAPLNESTKEHSP